ncbi:MAG TPA: glycosyltransferase, partial [Longimicrobiaceae bacterium]
MERAPSVVFLNRFYWPDVAATGQMLADLAEDLAAAGWKVTVVTSRTGYHAEGGPLPREEVHNGVRIVRVRATRFGRGRIAGRVGDYASYLAGAFLRLLRIPRPDLVVAMTDPPFLLAPALVAGRLRGA